MKVNLSSMVDSTGNPIFEQGTSCQKSKSTRNTEKSIPKQLKGLRSCQLKYICDIINNSPAIATGILEHLSKGTIAYQTALLAV